MERRNRRGENRCKVKKSIVDRFFSKVNFNCKNPCWEWTASLRNKYGIFYDGNKNVKAHRWSYQTFIAEIPSGMMVCHHCDNPVCVNPKHLFVGTCKDNLQDAAKKGRIYKGGANTPWTRALTHCKRGHKLSGDNLSAYKKRRTCLACMRLRWVPRSKRKDAAKEQK